MNLTTGTIVAILLSASAAGPALAQSKVYPDTANCDALMTQSEEISCRAQAPVTGYQRPEVPYNFRDNLPNNPSTYQGPSYPPASSNAPGTRKVQPIRPRVGGGQ